MANPSIEQLMEAANISRTHAYDILAEREEPSLKVAMRIYDATGDQFGILKGLPAEMVERLRPKAKAA